MLLVVAVGVLAGAVGGVGGVVGRVGVGDKSVVLRQEVEFPSV